MNSTGTTLMNPGSCHSRRAVAGDLFRATISQMLLGAQRQFDHAFKQVVCRKAGEIMQDQLLRIQPNEVAKLQRLAARGVDKIPVSVIDDDDVALGVEFRAPGL